VAVRLVKLVRERQVRGATEDFYRLPGIVAETKASGEQASGLGDGLATA